MMFTLRELGTPMPGSLTVSDGTRHLLELERSRKNPRMFNAPSPYSALRWYGAIPSLDVLYAHYQAIAAALGTMAPPEHALTYIGATTLDIFFGAGNKSGFALDDCDRATLQVANSRARAGEEVRAFLDRRQEDWLMAIISSSQSDDAMIRIPYVSLYSGRSPIRRMAYMMRVPGAGFPVESLVDCIEASAPQACTYTLHENEAPDVRFEPWPLSRDELVGILKEVENKWFALQGDPD